MAQAWRVLCQGSPGGSSAADCPLRRAATAPPSSTQVKGQLLRELLVESKAYGYLLGSGGAGERCRRLHCLACDGVEAGKPSRVCVCSLQRGRGPWRE